MQHREMLRHFLHVLEVEQCVEARLVCTQTDRETQGPEDIRTRPDVLWSPPAAPRLLTVQSNVVVGEDCGLVALGDAPHSDVQHSMRCLHVVFLDDIHTQTFMKC